MSSSRSKTERIPIRWQWSRKSFKTETVSNVVKGGVKLDHWGGGKLDQMSVWEVGLGSECGVWSGGLRSGLWTAFRPERRTPHSARDVVVI